MVGQEKLINKLSSYTLQTLPKSILLIGDAGCGKHTIVNELASLLNVEVVSLVSSDPDYINEYKICPLDKIYIIDLSEFNEKQQNQFLKLIEEPVDTMHIFLFAESELFVLNTIMNRCIKFYFEEYTEDQLRQIISFDNNYIYTICKTPGQLLKLDYSQVTAIKDLCEKILDKISIASYANTLSLITKFNFGEIFDKFDILLFFNIMMTISYDNFINTNSELSYLVYNITKKFKLNFSNKAFNKENLMINYFDELFNYSRSIA